MTSTGSETRRSIEHRQAKIWLSVAVVGIAVWLSGGLHHSYETIVSPSGHSYTLIRDGVASGPVGTAYEVRFLTESTRPEDIHAEQLDLLPFAIQKATARGDSLADVVAVRRRFEYGLFTLDSSVHLLTHVIGKRRVT